MLFSSLAPCFRFVTLICFFSVFLFFCSANKSEAKRIEDWRCPSGWTSPAGSRRRDGSADLKARAIDPVAGLQLPASGAVDLERAAAATTGRPQSVVTAGGGDSDNFVSVNVAGVSTPHIHVILLVFAGLILIMVVVGILSYYKALHSS